MASNCQIPTPQEYAIHMLDYIGYSKKLYGKRVLENSCGEGNILLEIVTRYIEKEHPVKWIQDDINRKAEKQKKEKKKRNNNSTKHTESKSDREQSSEKSVDPEYAKIALDAKDEQIEELENENKMLRVLATTGIVTNTYIFDL